MKSMGIAGSVFLFCLLSPTPAKPQDSNKSKPPADQKKRIMPKELLKSMVGSWEGTCQTWFQPSKVGDESNVKGEIRPQLDGRFIRHTYQSTMKGKQRHGEETIGLNSITKRLPVS